MRNMDRLFNKQMEDLEDYIWGVEGELLKAQGSGREDLIKLHKSELTKLRAQLLEYQLLK